MATGRTPLLNSLIAGGYVKLFPDYRASSLIDKVGFRTLVKDAGAYLQRGGIVVGGGPGTNTVNYEETPVLSGTEFTAVLCGMTSDPTTLSSFGDYLSNKGFSIGVGTATLRLRVGYSTGVVDRSIAVTIAKTMNDVFIGTYKAEQAAGMHIYYNGTEIAGAATSTVGKSIVWQAPATKLYFTRGSWAYGLLISKELSSVEVATITDELVNQIRYETQDCFWPVSATVYWRGAFGALAGETAMAAGRSIGDINELVVASGTHKMSTEKLDGILTKCLVCVTNGTINLPAYNLGANYVFEKFTASTGLWTTVTQASRAVALLAGDKILWANQTGNRYIKRIY